MRRVRGKGITYDTGFVLHTENSRQRFQPVLVERELRIIRDDPYCTAVRLTGGDPARIELAARFAVDLGLRGLFLALSSRADDRRDAVAVRRLR